jgi:hypothetical protein
MGLRLHDLVQELQTKPADAHADEELPPGWRRVGEVNDEPPLTFPTEADARAAYVQADQMYGERAARLGVGDE